MSEPVPVAPVKVFNFTTFQTAQPTSPLPGNQVDAEINRTNAAVSDVIDFVRQAITDDGKLYASLVYDALGVGQTPNPAANMVASNNLSELTNKATARANLQLGSAALLNTNQVSQPGHTHPATDITGLNAALTKQPYVVFSIADLKALSTSTFDGDTVIVVGYLAGSLKGAGVFKKSDTVLADNGGTIITNNANTRTWLRQLEGDISSADFGCAANGATDDTTAFGKFLTYLGATGGKGIVSAGTHNLTSSFTVAANKTFVLSGIGPEVSRLDWINTAVSAGIRIVVGLDVEPPDVENIGFLVGSAATQDALMIDNFTNISPTNKDAFTYSISGTGAKETYVENCLFLGRGTVTGSGWRNGVLSNCVPRHYVRRCNFTGLKSADQTGLSRSAVSFICRDYDSRTITNITVDAGTGDTTISWGTGTALGNTGGFVYIDNLNGDLGQWLNGRVFCRKSENIPGKTFVLKEFDGRELPAYSGGGTFEGAPQTATCGVINNKGAWFDRSIYMSCHEGYYIEDCRFIGGSTGLMVETQTGLDLVGYNHFNCTFRNLYFRDVGTLNMGHALTYTRDPALAATGVSVTKGVTTTGSFATLPWQFYEGCWVMFAVSSGMTQLNGNYYKLTNLNRTAKTFKLTDAVTGAEIDSSLFGAWAAGTMYIVGEHLVLERCAYARVEGLDMNGTGSMRYRGIRLKDCNGGGPSLIENNRFRSGGTYAAIELTAGSDQFEIGPNLVVGGSFSRLVWNKATGLGNIYMGRKNFMARDYSGLGISTLATTAGLTNTNPHADVSSRFAAAGTRELVTVNGDANPGQIIGIFNETSAEKAQAGAGLAILRHNGGANGFYMPDRAPRFVFPGENLDFVCDPSTSLWRPRQPDKMHSNFDFWTDFHTINLQTGVSGAAAAVGLGNYKANDTTRSPRGIATLETGTDANGEAVIGEFVSVAPLANGAMFYLVRLVPEVLADAGQDFVVQAGFFGPQLGGAGEITNGVYWEYDYTAGTEWQACTSKANVRTKNISSRTVNVNNYSVLGIFINGLGTRADFFYGDGQLFNIVNTGITTNIPITDLGWGVRMKKRAGTTNRKLHVDYLGFRHQNLRGKSE